MLITLESVQALAPCDPYQRDDWRALRDIFAYRESLSLLDVLRLPLLFADLIWITYRVMPLNDVITFSAFVASTTIAANSSIDSVVFRRAIAGSATLDDLGDTPRFVAHNASTLAIRGVHDAARSVSLARGNHTRLAIDCATQSTTFLARATRAEDKILQSLREFVATGALSLIAMSEIAIEPVTRRAERKRPTPARSPHRLLVSPESCYHVGRVIERQTCCNGRRVYACDHPIAGPYATCNAMIAARCQFREADEETQTAE